MKLISKSCFVIIALILFSESCFADGGKNPPVPQNTPQPPGGPIDSNILILLFFALGLGLYKIHQFKKYKKTPN